MSAASLGGSRKTLATKGMSLLSVAMPLLLVVAAAALKVIPAMMGKMMHVKVTMTGRILKEVDVKTIGITQIGVTMPVIMQMMKGMTPMSLAVCVTPTLKGSKQYIENLYM